MMTEQELVKKCLVEICRQNGFDGNGSMSQRDFEFISQVIEEKTGILISISTIKRLLNGEFSRMPQIATLNAISTYLGYKNWQDYKMTQETSPAPIRQTMKISTRRRISWKWPAVGLVVLAGLFLAWSFSGTRGHVDPHYERARFSANKTTLNAIPNSVIFHYDVTGVHADSFFIQQSWDVRRRVRIDPAKHTLTDIYYEPGYHIAKLIADDSVIKTIDISIPSDKWNVYTMSFRARRLPQYFAVSSLRHDGMMGLNPETLAASKIPTDDSTDFVMSYIASSVRASSDSFVYKARVRMTDPHHHPCPYIIFEVFCQRRFMFFRSMPKGCASETDAGFSNLFLTGKENDLSGLCYDLSQWTDIQWEVKGKQVTILINGQEAYHANYQVSAEGIAGLGIISNGLCELESIGLEGLDGTPIYQSDF